MCKKLRLSTNNCGTWYDEVVEIVDNRIEVFGRQGLFSQDRSSPLLSKPNVHKDIQDLHNQYVKSSAKR